MALRLTDLEAKVLLNCSRSWTRRYPGIAKRLGVPYAQVQEAGHKLQELRLAYIEVMPFNGSAIFLNERGETVKNAVKILARIRERRA